MLDLDARREARAEARRQAAAAQHEARGETLPIRIGGHTIAELPSEFPVTALAPLLEVDDEIGLLIGQAMDVMQARAAKAKARAAAGEGPGDDDDADTEMRATRVVIDLLAAYPNLPVKAIKIVRQVGDNIMGSAGVDAFLAAHPSREDVGDLIYGIAEWYGFSLGEASRSSESSTDDGGTLNTTSESTAEVSTPETPSVREVTAAS